MPAAASETAIDNLESPRSHECSLRIEAVAGLTLCVAAFWMVQHRYGGLVNDATLYALGALARLHPQSLGHDIFLGAGTQDHYTVFSPLAALLIRWVGTSRAAAWITLAAQLAYFGSGTWLARRLMPPALAFLAFALLVTLPDGYGAHHIFTASERVMTARMPANALVLAALAAWLSRRYVISGVCLAAAALLHPLMAVAGGVLLLMLAVGARRPWLTLGLGAGALILLWAWSWWIPLGPISQVDDLWSGVLRTRLSYDFPGKWPSSDWGHALVPLATLAVGSLVLDDHRTRSLCRAALATGVSGLCLSLIGSDLLHIALIMQAQPWRWLWIANVLALVLIPCIARDCLRSGPACRAAVLMLAAAWMGLDTPFLAGLSVLAVALVVLRSHSLTLDRSRLVLYSAAAVLVLAALQFAASLSNDVRAALALLPTAHSGLYGDVVDAWARGGILPAAIFISLWWLATHYRSLAAAVPALVAGLALCGACAPLAWHAWTDPEAWERWQDRFATWRREIPPDAQVLVAGVPEIPWFVLERPSYWSLRQMAGMVFSRPIAMELLARERQVTGYVGAENHSRRSLARLCAANPSLAYFITPTDMGPSDFASVETTSRAMGRLWLYRCADERH